MPATRYQRYLTVRELHRQGQTQLQIAEQVGICADTVAGWLKAPAFPERRIRSDRRRDQKIFLQRRERGGQPSLTRTHYSAGRVSALLNMPPQTLSAVQQKHLDAFLRFCPKAHGGSPGRSLNRRSMRPVLHINWENRCTAHLIELTADRHFGEPQLRR